jgi:hypothetical protein
MGKGYGGSGTYQRTTATEESRVKRKTAQVGCVFGDGTRIVWSGEKKRIY